MHYRYASGREGTSARLSIASNARAISLYALAADSKGWVAQRYRTTFPKAKVGKSCIRFRRLDDLDLASRTVFLREVAVTSFPAHEGVVTDAPLAAGTRAKTTRTSSERKRGKKRPAGSSPR